MTGHFARSCPNAWGILPPTNSDPPAVPPVEDPSVAGHADGIPPPADAQSLSASTDAGSEDIGLFTSQSLFPELSGSIGSFSQSILQNVAVNNEGQLNIPLHESGEGNEFHSTDNNVMSCISNEGNAIGNYQLLLLLIM